MQYYLEKRRTNGKGGRGNVKDPAGRWLFEIANAVLYIVACPSRPWGCRVVSVRSIIHLEVSRFLYQESSCFVTRGKFNFPPCGRSVVVQTVGLEGSIS
jgi:hypothetical protein